MDDTKSRTSFPSLCKVCGDRASGKHYGQNTRAKKVETVLWMYQDEINVRLVGSPNALNQI
ncbi:hypothetical protein Bhyg_15398, partial [Pseudolycoriella hygida]